jgi:hypothetical protein
MTDDQGQSTGWFDARLRELKLRRTMAQYNETSQFSIEQWLAIRKKAARRIDPETAEVIWCYTWIFDPYGIDPEYPKELMQAEKHHFARSPGSYVWVWFGDLPELTRTTLEAKFQPRPPLPGRDDDEFPF